MKIFYCSNLTMIYLFLLEIKKFDTVKKLEANLRHRKEYIIHTRNQKQA